MASKSESRALTPEEDRELQIRRELARRERTAKNLALVEELLTRAHQREEAQELYEKIAGDKAAERELSKSDLWYLLTVAMGRKDLRDHPNADWLFERCREVQCDPNGFLDLWARDHYKSTIITFALTIQDILNDPELTACIFSHTRPIAKAFLEQIKRELETNQFLKDRFPDVLWQNPEKEAPRWSLDGGIIVRRKSNPKEPTLSASGLVDGQPTGMHYLLKVYDDVVRRESVTTPDQIRKTTVGWELSLNLGSGARTRRRYIGTRYHSNDTWSEMIRRGSVTPRIHAATESGRYPGKPVLLSQELLDEKRRDMGPYTFGTQMLQNPTSDKAMSFQDGWLKFYDKLGDTKGWNLYLLADPASKKKKTSDYTVQLVVGLAPDGNYYLIAGIRDRMNLAQRTRSLFTLHREWKPKDTGYEEYGVQADVEHIEEEMERQNYRFNIKRLGGSLAKEDRIQKLIPLFEQKRIWLPRELWFFNGEGERKDLIKLFLDDEFRAWPVAVHDDMLDCLARILDPALGAVFPKAPAKPKGPRETYSGPLGWMG